MGILFPRTHPASCGRDAEDGKWTPLPAEVVHQTEEALPQHLTIDGGRPAEIPLSPGMEWRIHALNRLCVPSQSGAVLVCLHWHHQTVVGTMVSNFTGWKPVPLWLPSQKGGWPL